MHSASSGAEKRVGLKANRTTWLDLTRLDCNLGLQVGTLYMKIMYQYLPGGGAILEPMCR